MDVASTPTPEKSQLIQDCPAPVYMAKTRRDTTEPNERYVLSLYDGIGCLVRGCKDKFNSPGYTKYIAIEPDHVFRTIAQRSNPLNEMPKATIMQHGICGIHSPSKLSHRTIKALPVNSNKLFVAVIPEGKNCEETLTDILRLWTWVTIHNTNCKFLIQADVTYVSTPGLS